MDKPKAIKIPTLVTRKRVTRSGIPAPNTASCLPQPERRNENNKRQIRDEDLNQENVSKVKRRKTEVISSPKVAVKIIATKPAAGKVNSRPLRPSAINATNAGLIRNVKANEPRPSIAKKASDFKQPGLTKPNLPKSSLAASNRPSLRANPAKSSVASAVNSSKPTVPAVAATKRLPWDTRGKIQDTRAQLDRLLAENKGLKEENSDLNERVHNLETENLTLANDIAQKEDSLRKTNDVLANLQTELPQLKLKINTLEKTIAKQQTEAASLTETIKDLKTKINDVTAENADLTSQNFEKESINSSLTSKLTTLQEQLRQMQIKLRENENLRRKQHNQILELKGNIRVFCRVRPILNNVPKSRIEFRSDKVIAIEKPMKDNTSNSKSPSFFEFKLDHVFEPTATQSQIFEEVSLLVQNVLDGYNVCIFAYGQTGSGKTHTMQAPPNIHDFNAEKNNPDIGIIPRSVQTIFNISEESKLHGWKYTMKISMVEIYNEKLKDLLADIGGTNQFSSSVCNQSQQQNDLYIGEVDGVAILHNITVFTVQTENEVYRLLKFAHRQRSTAATAKNEHSSRSHCIFILRVTGVNQITGETCDGTLNLVDLSGSEKFGEGNLLAEKAGETKNINQSLSSLTNVILALSKNSEHIPYRNSKLTHLLKNSLGGNSKTLMLVNVSPDLNNIKETITSLRFATKVNETKIGCASKVKA